MYCLVTKRFPMRCHTLSIQVCRSTYFVRCKHIRWKGTDITIQKKTKKRYSFLFSTAHKSKTQPHSRTLLHTKLRARRLWMRDFLNMELALKALLYVNPLTQTVTTVSWLDRPLNLRLQDGASWGATAGCSDWVNGAARTLSVLWKNQCWFTGDILAPLSESEWSHSVVHCVTWLLREAHLRPCPFSLLKLLFLFLF